MNAWQTRKPAREGFDAAKLKAAIDFAVAHETKLFPALDGTVDPRDLRVTIPLQFAGPFSDPIGPLKPHAPLNGIVIRHGYIVAEWGDTHAGRHGAFRDQDVPVGDRGRRVRQAHDPRRERPRARLCPPFSGFRAGAQPADHLGRDAAPDLRLGRHDVGQAVVGGPSRKESVGRARRRPAARRQGVEIFRCCASTRWRSRSPIFGNAHCPTCSSNM